MRCVCISDTHNKLHSLRMPDGDILVHAGDLTMGGTSKEVATELQALAALPHAVKIFVAGNHDWLAERDASLFRRLCSDVGVVYLQDSSHVVDGVTFYGSPWQPRFCDWAFNVDRGAAIRRYWDAIPDDVDVLITHGPPHGYGDIVPSGERVGCVDLADAVARTTPRYHVFGHIHCGRGVYEGVGACSSTTFVNAACMGEDYRRQGNGVVIELDDV